MDNEEFNDFLNSIGSLKKTPIYDNSVERGAFNLPTVKINTQQKQETKSLIDSPIGKLPVIKQLTEAGVGIGTQISKAGLGLGKTFLMGANAVSNLMGNEKNQYNPIIEQMDYLQKGIFEDPYKKELSSGFGKAGQVVGDIALFMEGNKPSVTGQQFLTGGVNKLNIANKALNYGAKKLAQVVSEGLTMGGIQYAISGGDAKEAGTVGIVSGILSGITHVGADVFRKVVPQTVKEAVSKVFIPRGKMKLSGTENITDDAVGALETIKNLSPEIKVIDINGIEKPFVPSKATLLEMPQVLSQAKNKIYNAYTELATKAGDAGVTFGQKDFNSVIADLAKYEGRGYTPAYSNKARQIQEAINRFATQNPKDGMYYFNNTDPKDIQTLIEAINQDVNPLSDKAGAEVALNASKKLRDLLDEKISGATGEEYQQLRNAYKQLKSIEPEVINEFKKAMRGQGVQSDIIDKLASVDMIEGLLTMNPARLARSAGWEAVKNSWRKALGKQANLQRAFKMLEKESTGSSEFAQRIWANPTEGTPAFKAGQQTVEDIKNIPNKEGGFVNLGDKSPMTPIKVQNAPKGNYINVGMNRGTTAEKISEQEIKSALPKDIKVLSSGILKGEEDSLGLKLSRELTPEEMDKFLVATDQKAIPQMVDGVGKMYGTNEWGDFNPEYFHIDGRPLNDIVKTTNISLEQQAKGMSKEEFIKAQGTPVYHGTNYSEFNPDKAISNNGQYGKGVYFATDKGLTKQYGSKTIDAYLDNNSLLKLNEPLTNEQINNLRKVMGKDEWDWSKNPTGEFVWKRLELTRKNPEELLKKAGIKGVEHIQYTSTGNNTNYVIFDKSAIKTKSQLEAIWEKANKK